MKPLFDDTHPEIERRLIDACRARTPTQRLWRAARLHDTLRQFAEAETRQRFPGASDREVRLRVAARHLPESLLRAAMSDEATKRGDGADPEQS